MRFLSLATATAAAILPTQLAFAEGQTDALTLKMAELGIPSDSQITILKNIENGIMPMSDILESIPVSISTTVSGGFQTSQSFKAATTTTSRML